MHVYIAGLPEPLLLATRERLLHVWDHNRVAVSACVLTLQIALAMRVAHRHTGAAVPCTLCPSCKQRASLGLSMRQEWFTGWHTSTSVVAGVHRDSTCAQLNTGTCGKQPRAASRVWSRKLRMRSTHCSALADGWPTWAALTFCASAGQVYTAAAHTILRSRQRRVC